MLSWLEQVFHLIFGRDAFTADPICRRISYKYTTCGRQKITCQPCTGLLKDKNTLTLCQTNFPLDFKI